VRNKAIPIKKRKNSFQGAFTQQKKKGRMEGRQSSPRGGPLRGTAERESWTVKRINNSWEKTTTPPKPSPIAPLKNGKKRINKLGKARRGATEKKASASPWNSRQRTKRRSEVFPKDKVIPSQRGKTTNRKALFPPKKKKDRAPSPLPPFTREGDFKGGGKVELSRKVVPKRKGTPSRNSRGIWWPLKNHLLYKKEKKTGHGRLRLKISQFRHPRIYRKKKRPPR